MITIIEGRIGGGKTYSAVSQIAHHLAAGGVCWTNIELNWAGIERYCVDRYGVDIQPEQYRQMVREATMDWYREIGWGTSEMNVLVVIDEAQLYYNSRNWQRTQEKHPQMLSFLTQSRKARVDVVFITQSATNIDRQFRILADFVYSFRDMQKLTMPIIGGRWPFPQFLKITRDAMTDEIVGREVVWKDKRIYGCYNTNAMLNEEMARLQAQKADAIEARRKLGKSSAWKRLKVKLKNAW